MFFEAARTGKNSWWRYLVMFVVAFAASNIIGAIPLAVMVIINGAKDPSILDASSENVADLTVFGIEPNLALALIVFPFIIGLFTIVLLMKPLNGRKFISVINGSSSVRWPRIFISFLIWSALMAIYLLLSLKFNGANFPIHNLSKSLIVLAVISIVLIPFQSTFEEVLFRGYLMQGIGVASRSKWTPLIVTSVMFGLMHILNPEVKEFGVLTMMPQYIIFGFLFGIITVLDNGIELAIGAHAANNIFLSVFVTQKSSALQTVAMFEQQEVHPWTEFFILLTLSAVFVGILYLIYRWKAKGTFSLKN